MQETTKFPLLSGNLSIDLVNTEVVRRGQRQDLLPLEKDIWDWLYTVQIHIPFWHEKMPEFKEQLPTIKEKLLDMRTVLREQFDAIADQHTVTDTFISYLESFIERAPITYKLRDEQLIPLPLGKLEDMIMTIIALDALTLIAQHKLQLLKRCANTDCVLLFIDESGRRKWCSMKICGNRKKVAKFQHRKTEDM